MTNTNFTHQNLNTQSIPGFIDPNLLDKKMTSTSISNICDIGGMKATSYINKLDRDGHPISFTKEDSTNVHGFRKLYLLRDVLNVAINNRASITPVEQIVKKEKIDLKLTLTQIRLKNEIDDLKKQKARLRKDLKLITGNLSDISPLLSQTKFALVSQEDLIDKSLSYGDACGVYFLIKNKKIVYIGQSINIASRVTQHRDKDFDSVSYVSCDRSELDVLESLYILAYKPPLNGIAGGNGNNRPSTPISLKMIIDKFGR